MKKLTQHDCSEFLRKLESNMFNNYMLRPTREGLVETLNAYRFTNVFNMWELCKAEFNSIGQYDSTLGVWVAKSQR